MAPHQAEKKGHGKDVLAKRRGGQGKGFSFVLPHLKGQWGPVNWEPAQKATTSTEDPEVHIFPSCSSLGSATGEREQREGKRKGGRGLEGTERRMMQRQGGQRWWEQLCPAWDRWQPPERPVKASSKAAPRSFFFFVKREQLFPCGSETEKRSRGTRLCFFSQHLSNTFLLERKSETTLPTAQSLLRPRVSKGPCHVSPSRCDI